jgi:hypothetical protein
MHQYADIYLLQRQTLHVSIKTNKTAVNKTHYFY